MIIDIVWKVVDVAAMCSVVASVSFASLVAAEALWNLFTLKR